MECYDSIPESLLCLTLFFELLDGFFRNDPLNDPFNEVFKFLFFIDDFNPLPSFNTNYY